MKKKLALISVVLLVFGIVLGSPLVVKAEVAQSLLIGVKKDPGGGFTNADLNDRYWFSRLEITNFEASPDADIVYGNIDFNGAGLWDGQYTAFNSDGSTNTADATTFNGTYSVQDNGSFSFIFGSDTSTGHISIDADRNFAILSTGYEDAGVIQQAIVTAVRAPAVPFVSADLNGTWQYRDLQVRNIKDADRDASTCTVTFEVNNPNWSANYNCFDSNNTTDSGAHSGTYTLIGNTFNLFEAGDPEVLFSAYLSRDKSTLIFSRGSSSGGNIEQYLAIALKETAKVFTNADLSGSYLFHELFFNDFETNTRGAETSIGTVNCDGNGNWTVTSQSFDSDGDSGTSNASGTYSVNADGSFTLIVTSETPNRTFTGNISDNNNTVILSQGESISSPNPASGTAVATDGGGGGGCFITTAAAH